MLINMKELKDHFDGDMDIVSQLVEILEESYPVSLNGLIIAIAGKDFPSIRLHAHTLKGMVANFFAHKLKESAYFLEECGAQSELKPGYEVNLDALEKGLPALVLELKKIA